MYGGVSTLQFADHHVAKFTEESFDGDHHTFADIGTTNEFWSWLEGPTFDEFYHSNNQQPAEQFIRPPSFDNGATVLAGAVRIRQLRLSQSTCTNLIGVENIQQALGNCLNENKNDMNRWQTTPFGPNNMYHYGKYKSDAVPQNVVCKYC